MNIKMYGADWCSDCTHAKKLLDSKGIEFEYINIANNHDAVAFLEHVNYGKRIIPTLDINGEIYPNPGINRLMEIIRQ